MIIDRYAKVILTVLMMTGVLGLWQMVTPTLAQAEIKCTGNCKNGHGTERYYNSDGNSRSLPGGSKSPNFLMPCELRSTLLRGYEK